MLKSGSRMASALVLILLSTGCAGELGTDLGAAKPGTAAPTAAELNSANSTLALIPVKAIVGRDPSYVRDKFGDAWSDAGVGIESAKNGCDTRNDILKRDAQPGSVRMKTTSDTCHVAKGVWISPYTRVTIKTPTTIDIDHIIPLSRAWAAGAKSWDDQRRLNLANDPDNLLAVDRHSNRSKGDLGPGAWRPELPGQCGYAVRYIRVTKKYELPLTNSDVDALHSMLKTCAV